MWEIRSNCQRIAIIEALLLTTGMAVPDDPVYLGEPVPLYHKQREFKSRVFHRQYKITTDKRLRPLCRWVRVTFRYDLIRDTAAIQFAGDGKARLQVLVDTGFKLLEQTRPEEAKRIQELNPFELVKIEEKTEEKK